jgi:hypothetical protein
MPSRASRGAVREFHAAALAADGKDDGAPGLHPHYHASYYAAFVLDPDGHRIEVVCHAPEAPMLRCPVFPFRLGADESQLDEMTPLPGRPIEIQRQ